MISKLSLQMQAGGGVAICDSPAGTWCAVEMRNSMYLIWPVACGLSWITAWRHWLSLFPLQVTMNCCGRWYPSFALDLLMPGHQRGLHAQIMLFGTFLLLYFFFTLKLLKSVQQRWGSSWYTERSQYQGFPHGPHCSRFISSRCNKLSQKHRFGDPEVMLSSSLCYFHAHPKMQHTTLKNTWFTSLVGTAAAIFSCSTSCCFWLLSTVSSYEEFLLLHIQYKLRFWSI